ncbi:TIM barrel protein [Parathalassolituus penaei]|uniref:TIM barrel protein n=1 Tax=Parathalassolituus penaei TaxID=2997323 RepID=A0A9X3EBK7_9GAMM|nr:TIM barrel protein [Parathalassolituus penaei]MCY0964200.1 TIM barrel protein [Parathalassolituus penaei]
MTIKIASAPCCWGVDDPKNPYLPPWSKVLNEAAAAGYSALELGPYGYLPLDINITGPALQARGLRIAAGTIFDDLVDPANLDNLLRQTRDICTLLKQLPALENSDGQHFQAPYLVLIDHIHTERSLTAGHSTLAPRLSDQQWATTMSHIRQIAELARDEFGVRAVFHPHAGGYIEFEDEIRRFLDDLPYETIGLCLDTGHLFYSGMDPLEWLREQAGRLDYIHFKDIDPQIYDAVMNERVDFFAACARGVMCPIGKGCLDYPAIRQLLTDIGYEGYITIEQERDPRNADGSLEDVSASRAFLQTCGF